MSDIGRLLSQQEFESLEAAQAFMNNLMANGGAENLASFAPAADTPLDQAQDLMYEAWDATGKRRVMLARQALSLSPDCADAYVLLAEETAKTVEQAIDLYAQGVQAGERAIGEEAFEENVGHFWGIIETRPYMRARLGLAIALWAAGLRDEAIGHCTEMLRLNPGDNQGIRYLLANYLLQADKGDALGELLDCYDDEGSAEWLYTRALHLFRQSGDSADARASLQDALATNPFVPPYLLGRKRLPSSMPRYIGFGDESEAQSYAAEAVLIWFSTPGALDWLREALHDRPEDDALSTS